MNPALQSLRYDPLADFEPIGLVCTSPTLLVGNMHVPVRDVTDLIAKLKAKPDRYSYASAGDGTAPHFAAELFKLSTGTAMLGVPQHGAAPAVAGTISGQMQFMFPSLFTAYPHIKAGRLRAFAVAGPSRVPTLPDVPTLKESGVDEVDVTQWYALFAPTGTPTPVVQTLNEALNCVLADATTVERLENHGAEVRTSTPEELRSFVQAELARWRRVVQEGRLAVR